MLPFAPQDEPRDQEMEVFGGGNACSGEVSVVVEMGCSYPLPPFPFRTRTGGRRAPGRGAECQDVPLAGCRVAEHERCPN